MKEIIEELKRLEGNSGVKRYILIKLAKADEKKKNKLIILSGISSIFSALMMSAVIAEFFPSVVQVASVFFAFIGGFCAIFFSVQFKEKELRTIYSGASEFLRLRENISHIIVTERDNEEGLRLSLGDMRRNYIELCERYGQYSDEIAHGTIDYNSSKCRYEVDELKATSYSHMRNNTKTYQYSLKGKHMDG